ncbi:MAG: NfeD family protein [Actinomycetota bacterium]
MSFIIGATLAFMFLEWPWRLLVIVALAALEGFEVMLWLKLRRTRSITGAEGMLGARGKVVTDCDPDGQVRVKGALWRAHSRSGARAGEPVEVKAIDGLKLEVEALTSPPDPSPLSVPP